METKQLAEVRHYFSLSEHEKEPLRKLSYFEEALALVEEHSGSPDCDEITVAVMVNVRESQFRTLIQSLPFLHHVRLEVWLKYMQLLTENYPFVESAISTNVQLLEDLNSFGKLHMRYINQE